MRERPIQHKDSMRELGAERARFAKKRPSGLRSILCATASHQRQKETRMEGQDAPLSRLSTLGQRSSRGSVPKSLSAIAVVEVRLSFRLERMISVLTWAQRRASPIAPTLVAA